MEGVEPIGEAEASAAFSSLRTENALLLAVSGGPDSMALMGLMARWRRGLDRGPRLNVCCVDHRLRPESAGEALMVVDEAGKLDLPATSHPVTTPLPATGIQEAARAARYAILASVARDCGARTIVTAHHADDQAETVLARLLHGSGPAGLAGMRPWRAIERDLGVARPCLRWTKARLVATAQALGLPFATDPGNASPRTERGRLRAAMPRFEALGLTRERLVQLAERAARADEALAGAASDVQERHRLGHDRGFDRHVLDHPDDIVIRVLQTQLGGPTATRLERLERLIAELREARDAGMTLRRTAAGHIVELDRDGNLRLRPEGPRRRGRGSIA
ncbi:tRNA lysidine(34) synthetase TilS [Alsobacter sp. R-9]